MNLSELTDLMAGHIARPYTAEEILTILDDGEYSAELMLQHVLLLWKRTAAERDELLEALESFPGFTDDVSVGDPWIEKAHALIASVREGKP